MALQSNNSGGSKGGRGRETTRETIERQNANSARGRAAAKKTATPPKKTAAPPKGSARTVQQDQLAAAYSHMGQNYRDGECIRFVTESFGVRGQGQSSPSADASARSSMAKGNMHTSNPPIGAPVFWTGGRNGYGHAAIVAKYVDGKPWVVSTGINGKVALVPMSYFGGSLKYQGWSSTLNGIKIPESKLLAPNGAPAPYRQGAGTSAAGTAADGGGGGGGGGGGSPSGTGGGGAGLGFKKKDFYEMLAQKYGSIDTLLKLDKDAMGTLGEGKSIKWAIDQAVKEKLSNSEAGIARLATLLRETAWFKKYSEEITKRLTTEVDRPEWTKDQVSQVNATITATVNGMGVRVPPEDLAQVSRDAYMYGWTNEQIIDAVQALGNNTFEGGSIGTEVDNLHQFADDYGMVLSDQDINLLRTELMDGMGPQSAHDRIQDMAAQKYTVYADRIRAGEDLKTITSPYWQTASNLLEVSPDAISWEDPLFRNGTAFTKIDPTTGQQTEKTLNEFEADIRKDGRWLKTTNAQQTIGNAQYDLMKRFGFAA